MIITTVLLAMPVLFGAFEPSPVRADDSTGCRFTVRPQTRAPEIRGDDETTSRTVVMHQPDSPAAVVAVDLTGIDRFAGSALVGRNGRSVTIRNVSDRVLNRVAVAVLGAHDDGNAGAIYSTRRPLDPGATTRIELMGGSGTAPADEQIVIVVQSAEMAGCTYKPSQQWPPFERLPRADNSAGCRFAVFPQARAPEIRGDPETTSRAMVMNPPDSPVAVFAVDLTGMNLFVGGGWFERSGRYSVTIKNISDRVLNRVEVMVHIWSSGGGIGHGAAWPSPLEQGATARINIRSGRGSGTAPAGDVRVIPLVSSAEMAGCTYKPSQQWPRLQKLSQ